MADENIEEWERHLKEIRDKELAEEEMVIDFGRYEFRPFLPGNLVYCSMCGQPISRVMMPTMSELFKEVEAHERINHVRH